MKTSGPLIAILESLNPLDKRIPIHPIHFPHIDKENIVAQNGYAKLFGETNETLITAGFRVLPRNTLLETADVIFVLKPTPKDLSYVKKGATIIGWCHAVQQLEITRIAVKRSLTLIAMEEMYTLTTDKTKQHLFFKNNFMAGYLGVKHALGSTPITHSKDAKIAVITYGAVSNGAVTRLLMLGFSDITVFSRRSPSIITDKKAEISYRKIVTRGNSFLAIDEKPLNYILRDFDIIINGVMQDVLNPYLFLTCHDLNYFQNKLIIDISCDDHMGFDFACATTIDKPIIRIGENYYYAVENIPALQWQDISIPISEKLLLVLNELHAKGKNSACAAYIRNAIVINKGIVIDKKITEYQKRIAAESEA